MGKESGGRRESSRERYFAERMQRSLEKAAERAKEEK
jgi:hypothetical protein